MPVKYREHNFVYSLLKKASHGLDRYLKHRRNLILIVLIAVVGFYFLKELKKIFFVLLLTALGALSLIPPRYFKYSHYIGFELCMLGTVLTSLAYGPMYGVFTGGVSIFLGFVISGYFKPTYIFSVLTMPLMGLIVPVFRELPLFYIGMLMTLIYDAIILPLYVYIGSSRIVSASVFFITHVLLNAWVFSVIAPLLYRMMV